MRMLQLPVLPLAAGLAFALAAAPVRAQLACEQYSAALAERSQTEADSLPTPQTLALTSLRAGARAAQSSRVLPLLRSSVNLPDTGGYDAALSQAVNQAQEAMGLQATGRADLPTLLNMLPLSAKYRTEAAKHTARECHRINEAVRSTSVQRFVVVNLPSQTLRAYEVEPQSGAASEVFASVVVIGAQGTRTPVEDFSLWGLKFHPGWTPTTNILARNLVRAGRINRGWLASHQMRVTDRAGNGVPHSAVTVANWRSFSYRQPPGPRAPLGKLKFETTSGQDIYLHDTSEPSKFEANERMASSGCVRVDDIETLARWASGAHEDPAAEAQFDRALAAGKELVRKLPQPIPVFLSYQLVEFDEQGDNEMYYPDVYGRTKMTISVDARTPGAAATD